MHDDIEVRYEEFESPMLPGVEAYMLYLNGEYRTLIWCKDKKWRSSFSAEPFQSRKEVTRNVIEKYKENNHGK